VILVNIACASIPQLISIQGRLTDAAGVPLTGSNNLTFLIYDAYSGGSALWTEYHNDTNNLTVTNGVFNVLLGSITALNLPFNESYWLEVIVNGETQSPRINFTASAYAFRANKSEGLDCTGCVNDTHISSSANISPNKINGTAWTSANDGSGSGLDADTVDGSHKGNGSTDLVTGATADSWISGNISAHNTSGVAHPNLTSRTANWTKTSKDIDTVYQNGNKRALLIWIVSLGLNPPSSVGVCDATIKSDSDNPPTTKVAQARFEVNVGGAGGPASEFTYHTLTAIIQPNEYYTAVKTESGSGVGKFTSISLTLVEL
jgi:hypothetical protein